MDDDDFIIECFAKSVIAAGTIVGIIIIVAAILHALGLISIAALA